MATVVFYGSSTQNLDFVMVLISKVSTRSGYCDQLLIGEETGSKNRLLVD